MAPAATASTTPPTASLPVPSNSEGGVAAASGGSSPAQTGAGNSSASSQTQVNSTAAPTTTSSGGGAGVGHPPFVTPSLYIGDLHPDVTEAMLFEVFNSVGPVTSIRVCRDSVTRRSLCYAYVNYQTMQDAERSLDTLNYTPIKGQPCRIMWCQRDPSLRKSGSGNIFVKNLDRSIDNKALYDTFSLFGNILSCKVGVDENNRSKGYGFVHYENEASARSAIEKVNGMLIGGKTVYVGPFKTRSERDNQTENRYTNVYIKNLPKIWSDEDALQSVVQPFGEVTSLVVRQDPQGRHFAFCNFAEHKQAKACVDGLNGRRVGKAGFKEESLKKADGEQDAETTDGTNTAPETDPEDAVLFAGPHQSKAQRSAALRLQYEQLQQEKGDKYPGMNLYIKNIDDSIDDEKLRELFEVFGPTSSVKIMRDERGVSRGFAFVCFVNAEDATKAVSEMHLKHVKGKPLYVGLAERREQRVQRLQQRFRMPAMRGPAAGALPSLATATAATAPPHVAYGGPASLGLGGFAPRPLVGYAAAPPHAHQVPVLPWRQQQQQAFSQQQAMSMRQGLAPLQQVYGQQNPAAAAALQQVYGQQGSSHSRGGGRGGGGRGGAVTKQGQAQQQLIHKQQQLPGGGSFKFTPQMRNPRLEQTQGPPHHHAQQQTQQAQAVQVVVHPQQAGISQNQTQTQNQTQSQTQSALAAATGMDANAAVAAAAQPPPHILLNPEAPITAAALAAANPSLQKQMLGERLFPLVSRHQPELAGKITGMMLEMDNSELLILLESEDQLKSKIDEALNVLRNAN